MAEPARKGMRAGDEDGELTAAPPGPGARTIRVLSFVILVVGVLFASGLGLHYWMQQTFSPVHTALSLFLSVNLLICYWEACLFLCRSRVEARTEYWRQRRAATGNAPHVEFFTAKVPWTRVLWPPVWADVWATYAQFDPSFADRRTFGFNVDVANGFATAAPTLLLYAALTLEFLPARITGMIGLMLCWQWVYMTSVYWVSFFVANRQASVTRQELQLYVLGTNAPWVVFPLLGLYVSIRLIVEGSYSVLA